MGPAMSDRIRRQVLAASLATGCLLALIGCSTPSISKGSDSTTSGAAARSARIPTPTVSASHRWQHVVVVIEENRDAGHILGRPDAPYLNAIAKAGLDFTDMHGETHPSQPNYLALLSGSTQSSTDDSCPHIYRGPTLASQLLGKRMSFAGYSESLPRTGFAGCVAYPYARKHAPWVDFDTVPGAVSRPLTAMPADYSLLPTVSFVIPNLLNDMHDGTVARGDDWLRRHLGGYVVWARTHRSMLLVTWDEDEGSAANHIATIAVGDGITAGTWPAHANHYTLLAVLEHSFGLPTLGHAAQATRLPPLR